jgi:hypothetical protein
MPRKRSQQSHQQPQFPTIQLALMQLMQLPPSLLRFSITTFGETLSAFIQSFANNLRDDIAQAKSIKVVQNWINLARSFEPRLFNINVINSLEQLKGIKKSAQIQIFQSLRDKESVTDFIQIFDVDRVLNQVRSIESTDPATLLSKMKESSPIFEAILGSLFKVISTSGHATAKSLKDLLETILGTSEVEQALKDLQMSDFFDPINSDSLALSNLDKICTHFLKIINAVFNDDVIVEKILKRLSFQQLLTSTSPSMKKLMAMDVNQKFLQTMGAIDISLGKHIGSNLKLPAPLSDTIVRVVQIFNDSKLLKKILENPALASFVAEQFFDTMNLPFYQAQLAASPRMNVCISELEAKLKKALPKPVASTVTAPSLSSSTTTTTTSPSVSPSPSPSPSVNVNNNNNPPSLTLAYSKVKVEKEEKEEISNDNLPTLLSDSHRPKRANR